MKKLLITLAALAATLGTVAYANTIEISIDSKNVYTMKDSVVEKGELDAPAYISNDITMVPLRFVSENLGAQVEWKEETRQVVCVKDGKTITLTIDNTTALVQSEAGEESKELLSAPVIVEDRTFVPLRFVSENFDTYVEYVAPTRQVIITDEEPVLLVNDVRVDKGLIQAYYNDNAAYIMYYGPEAFFNTVYQGIVDMTAFVSNWGVIDSDTALSEEYMAVIEGINSDELAQMGILKSYYTKILMANSYLEKASDMMLHSFTDEQITAAYKDDYVCAKHILLSTVDETTQEPLSDDKKAEIKKKAEEVLAKVKKGEDFDALIKEFGQDPGAEYYPEGYVFTKGQMVEPFENATYALEENSVSELVESDFGYHIIKRLPLPELDEITKSSVNAGLAQAFINDLASNASVLEVTPREELYKALTPAEYIVEGE